MSKNRILHHTGAAVLGLAVAALPVVLGGCSGGTAGVRANRGPFTVTQITTGQGQIYPYRIAQLDDFGNPTANILNIESEATLRANVAPNNPVLPVATFPTTATLPDGSPGNQFLLIRFSHLLNPESILSNLPADQSTNSGLTTAISVVFQNQGTEVSQTLSGRAFVNGKTYFAANDPLTEAVVADADGNVTVTDPRANGFPLGFTGDEDLVAQNSFVFVADTDDDLTTFETFDPMQSGPGDAGLIRISVSNAVLDTEFDILEQEVCVATTVGPDTQPPQVLGYLPANQLQISPGNGDVGVDPAGSITVRFNKPVQPADIGTFFSPNNLTPPSGAVTLNVTIASNTFSVLYYADPLSFGDFCNYRLQPAYILPGETQVTVNVDSTNITGLNTVQLGTTVSTTFTTGEGPGIVNAPVSPDAIYVGVGGSNPGIAVIDLNGFGQGTGDLTTSRFPLNPNVGQPGITPNLAPGTSSLDAGGAGALTFTRDTRGNKLLLRSPIVGQVGDIHVGAPLDIVFNNTNINVNASSANQTNPALVQQQAGNTISTIPHPNPPRLVFPPPNPAQAIFAEEPTVTSSQGNGFVVAPSPPCLNSPRNGLVQGNPFGNSVVDVGLFPHSFTGSFNGPNPPPASPPPPPPFCPFTTRQQIGHFLYVLDVENEQILVVNSNRFTVLDTIQLQSPVSMSMSPTLGALAVTNFASSSVTIIDTNPFSPTFNQVVREVRVAEGPTGIAYQPDNEALLVVSTTANTLTVLDSLDYSLITTTSGNLSRPIELVVTERYVTSGFLQGIYFAYILNGDGTVAVYESGPAGPNGIGFNDIVTRIDPTFIRPSTIRLDYQSQNGGFYITHSDALGLGVVSRVEMTASPQGQLPINQIGGNGLVLPPTFRQREWAVTNSYGGDNPLSPGGGLLSGNSPTDVATDDMFNSGAAAAQVTQQNAARSPSGGSIIGHSSKSRIFIGFTLGAQPTPPAKIPTLLFVSHSDTGTIDVINLNTGAILRTLTQENVTVLASYWRQ